MSSPTPNEPAPKPAIPFASRLLSAFDTVRRAVSRRIRQAELGLETAEVVEEAADEVLHELDAIVDPDAPHSKPPAA